MKQKRLKNEYIASLCTGLAYLLHAGTGIGDALSLMAEDEPSSALKEMLSSMSREADEGRPLSSIFKDSGLFPSYVYSLLSVGEQVGRTEDTLASLARYYDSQARMERHLRTSLTYPAVLLAVLLAVVTILLIWVLPVFNDVYAQLGSQLTGVAGLLLSLGAALKTALPFLGALIIAAAALFLVCVLCPGFRTRIAALFSSRRGESGFSREVNTVRFAQALSMALSSGLDHSRAVLLASGLVAESASFAGRCTACTELIENGEMLPRALSATGLLQRSDCRLLEAGIRGGSAEAAMEQISKRLLEENEYSLEVRVSRIEPILVVIMSVLVGAILLSVMLPLINIMGSIG